MSIFNSLSTLAVIYAAGVALLDILVRSMQRTRDRSWAAAFVGSWAGAAVLCPLLVGRDPNLAAAVVPLLGLSGVLWAAMVYCDFKALEFADASLAERLF